MYTHPDMHSLKRCAQMRGQRRPRDIDGNTNSEREALVGKKKNPEGIRKRES